MNGITFIDVDSTLLETTAKVVVRDVSGNVLKRLSSSDFNRYSLKDGESFDFTEFSDAKLFNQTSRPIRKIFDRVDHMVSSIEKSGRKSKIIILTARSEFDDMETVKETFKKHGMKSIDKIPFITVGSMSGRVPDKKTSVIKSYLDTGLYTRVRLYDDHPETVVAFRNLEIQYPQIKFFAYLVVNGDPILVVKPRERSERI
jgi:hypothetical protein